jgi:hypothetical protein
MVEIVISRHLALFLEDLIWRICLYCTLYDTLHEKVASEMELDLVFTKGDEYPTKEEK